MEVFFRIFIYSFHQIPTLHGSTRFNQYFEIAQFGNAYEGNIAVVLGALRTLPSPARTV